MPICGLVGGYSLFAAARDEPYVMALQSRFAPLGIGYAEALVGANAPRHDIEKGT
jgi:hypothetical protein